jgi:hypothetical protein
LTIPVTVMSMILGDIQIPVQEASVSGYILDPDWLDKYGKNEKPGLEWEVVVQTEERTLYEETEEEIFLSPRLSWAEFSFPAMRRWLELEGKTIHFDAADGDLSAPHPFSYFDTHEMIPDSTLKFVKRAGNKFLIHWEGTCDPLLEEPYYKNVPFRIQTEAAFKEINIHAGKSDTDATTLERLSKYLDPADFIQQPMKETVHPEAVENRFGMIDPLLRWVFGRPGTRRRVFRYSVFEPRA